MTPALYHDTSNSSNQLTRPTVHPSALCLPARQHLTAPYGPGSVKPAPDPVSQSAMSPGVYAATGSRNTARRARDPSKSAPGSTPSCRTPDKCPEQQAPGCTQGPSNLALPHPYPCTYTQVQLRQVCLQGLLLHRGRRCLGLALPLQAQAHRARPRHPALRQALLQLQGL
jgi:hypothetical protein